MPDEDEEDTSNTEGGETDNDSPPKTKTKAPVPVTVDQHQLTKMGEQIEAVGTRLDAVDKLIALLTPAKKEETDANEEEAPVSRGVRLFRNPFDRR